MTMSDKQLENLSYELDDILVKLCIENRASPLVLSSVLLARMMLLNENSGSIEDFRRILSDAIESKTYDSEKIH